MNKFFVSIDNVGRDYIDITNEDDIKHIEKVLRLKKGDQVEISDENSWDYVANILEITKDYVRTKILDRQKFEGETFLKTTLYQGMPKGGKMELIIQKNVELGISNIVPVYMDRSVTKPSKSSEKKIKRYNSISKEAAKQSKRGIIPKVHPPIFFDEMLPNLSQYDLVVFPYEENKENSIRIFLEKARQEFSDKIREKKEIYCAIIIGPEGGFSKAEAESLKEKSIEPVTLGRRILRTETAGLTTLAMVNYSFEL